MRKQPYAAVQEWTSVQNSMQKSGGDAISEDHDEAAEVYVLRFKRIKGKATKELDPRYFDEKEWCAFRISDDKEWQSLLEKEAVRVLTPEQAKKVPHAMYFERFCNSPLAM